MAKINVRKRACDVLNWDYMVSIAEQTAGATTLAEAVADFAYNFTSTSDETARDDMLAEWLNNATHLQSTETAELIVQTLAVRLNCYHELLRRFAEENGVRLKRG